MKNYLSYSEDDFILDPDFRQWVFYPTEADEYFWNKFLAEHRHKKQEIEKARLLLSSTSSNNNLLPCEQRLLWSEIKSAIKNKKMGRLLHMFQRRKPLRNNNRNQF